MFTKRLTQFLLILVLILTALSPFSYVYADNYVKNDDDDDSGASYYIVKGKDVDDLFDFGLYDVDNLLAWIVNFKTYTVIKEYEKDDDTKTYKVYFNTPNLQSIVKNKVISNISDGFTDDTYNVNDTERMVKVGKNATTENVITKYGFNIPNYTYMGEYPKETMSIAGIVPTTWYGKVWTAIKSVVGCSFIDAPDSDNFNTITYQNHTYKDKSEYIVKFLKKYYIKYFDRQIASAETEDEYFNNAEDLVDSTVSEDTYNKAVSYNDENKDKYKEIEKKKKQFEYYSSKGMKKFLSKYKKIDDIKSTKWICKRTKYQNSFRQWANQHTEYTFMCISSYCKKKNKQVSDFGLLDATSKMPEDNEKLTLIMEAMNDTTLLSKNLKANIEYTDKNGKKVTELVKLSDALSGKHKNDIKSITDETTSASLDEWKEFANNISYNVFKFEENDFYSDEELSLKEAYEDNEKTIEKYEKFAEKMDSGDEDEDGILYKQCMIENEGKDGECYSKKYGEKTTISIAQVYAYSGLYKITKDYPKSKTKLTNADAHKILNLLQSYCGPYYSEVLGNIMKLICETAEKNNDLDPLNEIANEDPRIMPYDTQTLVTADQENYECTDPRVELYKDHIIGKLVSNFTLNYGFGIFIKPQKVLVDFGGRITELSVFMQQLMNFDVLDGYGLSPTTMWTSTFVGLFLALCALFFIVKTVSSIIKMGTGSAPRILIAFLFLFIELGLFTAISISPDQTWNSIKKLDTSLMNLGEAATVYNDNSLVYLFGDNSDMEVTYYMPYLDLWSKFNTGYGMLDSQQKINKDTDKAELNGIKYPKIGSNDIQHYSVLLMDSFSYYGESTSAQTSIMENNMVYNGNVINNNAYRVIDHFMAPRVTIETKKKDTLGLTIKENENYNGEIQSGVVGLIVKLLNCTLMCLMSLIKFLTFMWQWFMFYIFIFKVILARSTEGKNWSDILLEVFSPTLCIIVIGMYSGIIMTMGMNAVGLLGICLELFLFWLTFMALRWWKGLRRGQLFPATLNWLYVITNLSQHRRNVRTEELITESKQNALDTGIEYTDEEITNLKSRTERLFNTDGTYKTEFDLDGKHSKAFEDWYKFAVNSEKNGKVLTDEERRAKLYMESDDRFVDFVKQMNEPKTKHKQTSTNKTRQKINKDKPIQVNQNEEDK